MRFYVYALIDPRNREVFYIGKGTGARVAAHEAATKSGAEKNLAKAKRIKEIWAAGCAVERRILGRSNDEQRAFRWENRLIARLGPQTNIKGGSCRQYSFFRVLKDALLGRAIDPRIMKSVFPRETMPSDEHRTLHDLISVCIEKQSKREQCAAASV